MTTPKINHDEQQKQNERQTGGRQIYADDVDVGRGKDTPAKPAKSDSGRDQKPNAERPPATDDNTSVKDNNRVR